VRTWAEATLTLKVCSYAWRNVRQPEGTCKSTLMPCKRDTPQLAAHLHDPKLNKHHLHY
jgi:hypothetical protein